MRSVRGPRTPLRVPIGNRRGPWTENPSFRPALRPAGATSPPSNQRQSLSLPPIRAEQQAGLRSGLVEAPGRPNSAAAGSRRERVCCVRGGRSLSSRVRREPQR
ncbi:hypothetical protein NN561_004846 [Cricetulus griseus]